MEIDQGVADCVMLLKIYVSLSISPGLMQSKLWIVPFLILYLVYNQGHVGSNTKSTESDKLLFLKDNS